MKKPKCPDCGRTMWVLTFHLPNGYPADWGWRCKNGCAPREVRRNQDEWRRNWTEACLALGGVKSTRKGAAPGGEP